MSVGAVSNTRARRGARARGGSVLWCRGGLLARVVLFCSIVSEAEAQPLPSAPDTTVSKPAVRPGQGPAVAVKANTAGVAAEPIHTANAPRPSAAEAPAGSPPSAPSAPPAARTPSEVERRLLLETRRIRHLMRGRLALDVQPRDLFDIDLTDEGAIQLERARLQLLFEGEPRDGGAPPRMVVRLLRPRTAQSGAHPGDAGAPSAPSAAPASWSADELRARIRLDRARLSFYDLSPAERKKLLEAHLARQAEVKQGQVAQQLSEADERGKEAERQQREALAAAQSARTEALRLVSEEHARLLGIAAAQAGFEKELVAQRAALEQRREAMLSWRRRVREAVEAARGGGSSASVDGLYVDLRRALRHARDDLAAALSNVSEDSRIPEPGEDRLADIPEEINASAPRELRHRLQFEADRLQALEAQTRADAADAVYEQVQEMNADRLQLYPFLSSGKRDGIVGFSAAGLEQARAEARQVSLVVKHRLLESKRWFESIRTASAARSASAWAVSLVALKWLLPVALFVWWRRRADKQFREWFEAARRERRSVGGIERTRGEAMLAVLVRAHRPAEALLLVAAVLWLLPDPARSRLEVELLSIILYWVFGGVLVVTSIDTLARRWRRRSRRESANTGVVRLRSLKLLGRIVVAIALFLSLTDRLVGKGTIYDWVLSTAWLVVIPVAFVITHWWRDIIFSRLEIRRRKPPLVAWALEHRTGWRSLPIALGAGLLLLYSGVVRSVKPLITRSDISRKVLAYLFRRDLSRRADDAKKTPVGRLEQGLFTSLGPSTKSATIVDSVADLQVGQVIEKIGAKGGGVFALVGERGSGKSTILKRIAENTRGARLVPCPHDTEGLAAVLSSSLSVPPGTSFDDAARIFDQRFNDAGLLVDDAHRLVKPKVGGLAAYDELLGVARNNSKNCCWVLAFDDVTWSFLMRARGAKPQFDDVIWLKPWSEEAITRLLAERCRAAGIEPSFSELIEPMSPNADEVDREDALERTETGYYRLIWDYSTGNPGIALHTWRQCLGSGPGQSVVVKTFEVVDSREFEALPDDAVFVLRAVVQLEYAELKDIYEVTQLAPSVVENALRYSLASGFIELVDGRYWVRWTWYRALTRFLKRRHLLVN